MPVKPTRAVGPTHFNADRAHDAALYVCDRYPDPDDARPILQALGLVSYTGHATNHSTGSGRGKRRAVPRKASAR